MAIRGYLFLCYLIIGSLFAVTGLRQFFVEPIDNSVTNSIWFALQVVPLLFALILILRPSRNHFVYCALIAQLYFIHGVMLCFSVLREWGYVECALALALTAVASFAAKKLGPPPEEPPQRASE